ncbi:MAG: stalk domain-containing protein [bacterium]|nr:stalk domain-containing protein [bacterium]
MKKKVTLLTAGVLCAAGVVVGASAAGVIQKVQSEIRPDFTVKVDGKTQTFKNVNGDVVYPMLYDGTTYLPIRAIGELMGKTVYWYEADKLIELKSENTTVTDADVIVTDDKDKKPDKTAKPKETLPPEVQGITIDKAKEIALQKAGLSADEVFFEEASYDFDDGRWICEIEFKKDKAEYSAEILVSDGTVISWDVDID